MPEGDSVWLWARRMHAALAGQVLVRSDFRVPALATTDLRGRRVVDVVSRGKHMLTRVEGGLTLHTHLGMEGRWRIYRDRSPLRGRWGGDRDDAVRVVLETDTATAVGYRLPVVELVASARERELLRSLGPDLLGGDWDAAEALRRLAAESQCPISDALLDQHNLAGIGNVYKSELLFLRGLSPWTSVGEIADLAGLVTLAHRLLDANKHRSGHVTTGDLRRGRQHYVYGRQGEPCRRCGARIRRAPRSPVAGERVTYWCPQCQPGPSPQANDDEATSPRRPTPR